MDRFELFEQWARQIGHYPVVEAIERFKKFMKTSPTGLLPAPGGPGPEDRPRLPEAPAR